MQKGSSDAGRTSAFFDIFKNTNTRQSLKDDKNFTMIIKNVENFVPTFIFSIFEALFNLF